MKGFSGFGNSPAKTHEPGHGTQKYDLSKATVDGKHPQTEKNKKYKDMDKADLFLHGQTKDKEGNIKDIQWAPGPVKRPKVKKKSPAKQTTDRETMRQRAREKKKSEYKPTYEMTSEEKKARNKKQRKGVILPKVPGEGKLAHYARRVATWGSKINRDAKDMYKPKARGVNR